MQGFLTALIECSVSMSVLVLGFIALTPWLSKKYAPKWLYYAWLIITAGFIVPVRFHTDIALIQMKTAPPYIQHIIPGNVGNVAKPVMQTDVLHSSLPVIPWYQIAGFIWIIGTVTFIAYHGLKHYRFIKMVNRWCEQGTKPELLEALQKIKSDMEIDRQVKLQICSCVSSPMMIGFVKPVILLPSSNYSMDELQLILRHELVHFRRKDLWYKSLVFLATAIHWFNPVIYLMAKFIAVQCEISCDAEVVKGTDVSNRQRYSETIIGVIKSQSRMQTAFSTNFYGGKNGMKKRILSIMDTKKKKTGVIVLCLILIGTMGTDVVFATSATADNVPNKNIQITTDTALDTVVCYSDESGKIKISTDDGKTWMSEEEFKKAYPTPEVVWWTYDEYKTWLEQEKIDLQNIIGEKAWNPTDGWFVWTQEKVDEAIKQYEKILKDIKDGIKVSKIVNGSDEVMMSYNPGEIDITSSYGIMIVDDKDNKKNFGPYDSREDLLAAVKPYCDKQVKKGNLKQSEADEIISKVNAMQ